MRSYTFQYITLAMKCRIQEVFKIKIILLLWIFTTLDSIPQLEISFWHRHFSSNSIFDTSIIYHERKYSHEILFFLRHFNFQFHAQLAIRWVFRRVDLSFRWASKFYIGFSVCHFPMGRGLGDMSFRQALFDHSNDCFRGDQNSIKIKMIFVR